MGEQVIRQPNGAYAIYSSHTKTILAWDMTPDDIINRAATQAADQARDNITTQVHAVEAGQPENVYHQFALTWDEAVAVDRGHGGSVGEQYAVAEAGAPDEVAAVDHG